VAVVVAVQAAAVLVLGLLDLAVAVEVLDLDLADRALVMDVQDVLQVLEVPGQHHLPEVVELQQVVKAVVTLDLLAVH
jgi:hypothetical protein